MYATLHHATNWAARHLLLVVGLVAALVLARPAESAQTPQYVTYEFTGAVMSVSGTLFGLSPSIGQPVRGSFTYDMNQPGYDFGSGAAYIQQPPSGMSVVLLGSTLRSQNYNSFQVVNDSYGVDNFNGFFTPISVDGVLLTNWSSISFGLIDSTRTALSSKALPPSLSVTRFGLRTGSIYDAGTGGYLTFSIDTLTPPTIPVSIDIKPGEVPNSINPRSQGVIPVAILSTASFDATGVEPATVRFGRAGTETAPRQSALEDVNMDQRPDLILHFATQAAGIQCGDTLAYLTGRLVNGQAITGSDGVQTVGCK